MTKIAICRIPLLVLAGVLALAPMIAAQSSVQAEANAVSIAGRVSCSRFGPRHDGLVTLTSP